MRTLLFLLATASILFADSVTTNDGSILNGTLSNYSTDAVTIQTDFAGAVTIQRAAIKEIRSSEQRYYRLSSGNTLLGGLTISGDNKTIQTANGAMNVTNDTISATWGQGEDDPAVAVVKNAASHWTYEAAFDLAGKSGNTEKMAVGGRLAATLASPEEKLLLFISGKNAEENGELTEKEIKGGIDFERKTVKPFSWYTRVGMEHDEIEKLDMRTTAAAGLGMYLIEKEDHELRGRLGLQVTHESYETGTNETSPGIDVGLYQKLKLASYVFTTNVEYKPAFEDFSRYTVAHESHVGIPLAKNWAMRLGVTNDYNSQPAGGTEELDTGYFAHLVLKWQ